MNKALIVYGTRYGAAASTSEEIANTLGKKESKRKLLTLKKKKSKT